MVGLMVLELCVFRDIIDRAALFLPSWRNLSILVKENQLWVHKQSSSADWILFAYKFSAWWVLWLWSYACFHDGTISRKEFFIVFI
jgi:hypothetical protein